MHKKKEKAYNPEMALIETIKENLSQKMAEKGLSRRALSQKAAHTDDLVRNIFNGESRNPSIETMVKLADALDCSIDELCGRELIPYHHLLDMDQWAHAVTVVDSWIAVSPKKITARDRAEMYALVYECNAKGMSINDANQFGTVLRLHKL